MWGFSIVRPSFLGYGVPVSRANALEKEGITKRSFVLVHGMSHGAWCWDAVRARLTARGHRVLAVDLPGHGPRAAERHRASLDAYARAVADAMAQAGVHDAMLVGHSMAGAVIPGVATRVASRIAHVVFLAAVVLEHGSRLQDATAPATRRMMAGLAAAGGGAVQYPAVIEWQRWMTDVPAGDARLATAFAHLTPQPWRPWQERIDMRAFHALRLPRTYVRCLRDQAIPPERAAVFAARLGVAPVDLDCDHGPMMSNPDLLVTTLESV
jgi:pimeloyl-ACP methyl ester carboxylesterase